MSAGTRDNLSPLRRFEADTPAKNGGDAAAESGIALEFIFQRSPPPPPRGFLLAERV